jgi:hypothetical protein
MAKQITPTQAKKLCDNFDVKYAELSKLIGKDDNRSCYFSLPDLKNYIAYLEKSNQKIDGIRIYFGSYDKTEKNKEDMTTVFLAPTSNKVDDLTLNSLNYGEGSFPPQKKFGN